jgi:hypothetical protein
MGIVPGLGAGAVQQTRREEHGPVTTVEKEDLTGVDTFENLPPARSHRTASVGSSTRIRALALTTARVESLA